jgi:hypothetical protein
MASPRKIIVNFVQSQNIHRILKADKGDTPLQDFIDLIAKEGEVEPWVAERFAGAWRWNHRQDNNDEQPKQATEQQQTFYIANQLPRKTDTATKGDPASGTGKVAQIIALAEEGKSTAEIIELGFNKSTVYRQVSEWKKRKAELKKLKTA